MKPKYLVMLCLYLGYMMHTYSRRSFQNVINYVLKEKLLETREIGMIISAQQTGYTLIKFVLPFILDDIDPKLFFSSTMIGSFSFVGLFSYSKTLSTFCTLYFLHGFVLGLSWPTLVKILKRITTRYELGTWWSIQCTSSNLASISGAVISTLVSEKYGWRNSMRLCAYVNLAVGMMIILVFLVLEIPLSEGRSNRSIREVVNHYSIGFWEVILSPILLSNGWYFFSVHICRYVISDWYQVHLLNLKFTQMAISSFISSMELGGAIGSMCAGFASDYFIVRFESYKNPRLFVLIACGLCTCFVQHNLVFYVTEKTSTVILSSLGFSFGLFLFGPIAVSGVIAMEAVPQKNQGLSFSINSIYANMAMLFTGYPMSVLASMISWKFVIIGSYLFLLLMTVIIAFIRYKPTPLDLCISHENEEELMRSTPSFLFSVYSNDKKIEI